jgi:hypothetical protein
MNNSRKMRLAGYVASIQAKRNEYRVFGEKDRRKETSKKT